MILTEFSLVMIGFIALSLAMKRHFLQVRPRRLQLQQQAQHKNPSKQQILTFRVVGTVCLVLSGIFCIVDQGIAVGLVFWTGLITLAALLQSLLLTYRPQWVMPMGIVMLIMGITNGLAK